ncbi:MAG: hypothetical protein M1829_000657 [Trizodia sp. TS-e1964]|nr:MAG: hypothetical protein M1829_000657 [Trizodia sp. TS-e1964]
MQLTLSLLALAFAQLAPAQLAKRDPPACTRDTLFNCLNATPSLAGPFCNSVLAPTVTSVM